MHTTAITASTTYTPITIDRTVASAKAPAVQTPLELSTLELPTRESLAQDTASFAADVRKKFVDTGVQVPPNPILSSDFQGHVRVVNQHPDKDKIEQLFKDKLVRVAGEVETHRGRPQIRIRSMEQVEFVE